MLKGICAGSLAGGSVAEKLSLAKDAGFEAVEFATGETGGPPSLQSRAEELAAVKAEAARQGVQLSSTLGAVFWQHNLASDDEAERQQAVELAGQCLRTAKALGAGCVLIVPAVVYTPHTPDSRKVRYDQAYDRALACFKQIAELAVAESMDVGVENVWNGFLLSPTEFARFIDEVDCPNVGAYFDVGNVLPLGDPADWITILGSRIKRVHVKDFKKSVGNINGFVPLLSGDVPWAEVIAALEAVGYDGPLTAEMGGYKYHSKAVAYHTSTALDFILGRK